MTILPATGSSLPAGVALPGAGDATEVSGTTQGEAPSWRPGTATGIGSLPGTDIDAAVREVFGELEHLPYLPELPARGVGADLVGRGAALLSDFHVDLQPSGWRSVNRPGLDERRARDLLVRDLDSLQFGAVGYTGLLKVQAAGPWTLAATVELHRGEKLLADRGAVRDVTGALADGLTTHVADIRRRVPGAQVLVQLDEPLLPAVLAARVATASGFGALRRVPGPDAAEGLSVVVEALRSAGAETVVHCCARDVPFPVVRQSGAAGVCFDSSLLRARNDDALGELADSGRKLFVGAVPSDGTPLPDAGTVAVAVRRLWHRLGLAPELLPSAVVVTPACGLAGVSAGYARAATALCREVAGQLAADPEA